MQTGQLEVTVKGIDDRFRAAWHGRALKRVGQPDGRREQVNETVDLFNRVSEARGGEFVRGLSVPRLQILDGEGGPAPVVAGQVLVPLRDERADEVAEFLAGEGFDEFDTVAGMRVFEGEPRALAQTLDAITAKGYPAAPNAFMALKGVQAKGDATPEVPDGRVGTRAQAAKLLDQPGAAVAVVDVGLPPGVHDGPDAWLADVERGPEDSDNVDLSDLAVFDPNFMDPAAGHGAFVMGLVRQTAPLAMIGSFGAITGLGGGSELDVARAIRRAADWLEEKSKDAGTTSRGVINLSLGTWSGVTSPPLAVELAINELPTDVLVVAAAGNEHTDQPTWPAAFKRVIAVGSLTYEGDPADWSGFGHWVDVSTEGEGLISTHVPGKENPIFDPVPETFPDDPMALWSGTSFSTPIISGWLARWLAANPTRPAGEALNALRRLGLRVPGYGHAVRRDALS